MTDDAIRHSLSVLEDLLASGTPEAHDLAERAHEDTGSPPVLVNLPAGPWAGRAVLVDAGTHIVAAHVSSDGGRMTLRALTHGRAWLLPPVEACMRVLERGTPVSDQHVHRPSWCWPTPFPDVGPDGAVDLGDLREVAMPPPAAVDAMLDDLSGPLDPDLRHAIRVTAWRLGMGHLLRDLPPDRADLVRLVLPQGGTAEIDDLVALLACMSVPNPSWVAAAAGRHPALLDLFARPGSTGDGPHRTLMSLGEGASPFSAARTVVLDALYVDGQGATPSAIVVRDLAGVRDLEGFAGSVLAIAVAMLEAFHRARPSHAALSPDEARAVVALAGSQVSASVAPAVDVVGCMLHRGRVRALPPDLGDAFLSLGNSLRDLRQAYLGGRWVWEWQPLATGMAFPPGRTWASLARIDERWHASVDAHEDALDALSDALGTRGAGPHGAGVPFQHFLEGPCELDGVAVAPMIDRASFRAEGVALSHCVASHADRARRGSVQCVSLSGPGMLRSTAEFACDAGTARLVQHRGASNREPPASHARAAATLLAGLAADRAVVGRLAAGAARSGAHGPVDAASRDMTAGERSAFVETHFRNVALWLPPSVAARGADDWMHDAFGPRPEPVPSLGRMLGWVRRLRGVAGRLVRPPSAVASP